MADNEKKLSISKILAILSSVFFLFVLLGILFSDEFGVTAHWLYLNCSCIANIAVAAAVVILSKDPQAVPIMYLICLIPDWLINLINLLFEVSASNLFEMLFLIGQTAGLVLLLLPDRKKKTIPAVICIFAEIPFRIITFFMNELVLLDLLLVIAVCLFIAAAGFWALELREEQCRKAPYRMYMYGAEGFLSLGCIIGYLAMLVG